MADADAYQTTKSGEAEATTVQKVGEANAAVQKAVANALKDNGENALRMKLIELLPQLNAASAKAMGSINDLTVFNGAKGVQEMNNMPLAQVLDLIKKSTGLDLVDMLNKRANGTQTINGALPVKSENDDNK